MKIKELRERINDEDVDPESDVVVFSGDSWDWLEEAADTEGEKYPEFFLLTEASMENLRQADEDVKKGNTIKLEELERRIKEDDKKKAE